MRALLIACVALVLAGCDHLYGAGDVKVADTDKRTLVALARAEADRAGMPLENRREPLILDEGGYWVVILDPPPPEPGWKGGGIEVTIDKKTLKMVSLQGWK